MKKVAILIKVANDKRINIPPMLFQDNSLAESLKYLIRIE